MKRILILCALALLSVLPSSAAEAIFEPSGTYLYTRRGDSPLYLDFYEPAAGSADRSGTTLLFVFGGGFKTGERDAKWYQPWFRQLTEDGFRVVSIDYRLGLKDVQKMGPAQVNLLEKAIWMAVEDLFAATRYLADNSEALGVDPARIVICGSSAGAITVLQAEWARCNADPSAAVLPKDFRYAGVISFAGAVLSRKGAVRYGTEPAPTLLLHGTADKIVEYDKIHLLRNHFDGSSALTRLYAKNGYNYNTLRFKDRGHEIAGAMLPCYPETLRFLEANVLGGQKRIVDATVDDPSIAPTKLRSLSDIY
ncbi:MAG: alpha/beta hydrolase [Bacteroidales bacterium]|nr:alpha/beta hydrolase [Bacteroidales bacterium]